MLRMLMTNDAVPNAPIPIYGQSSSRRYGMLSQAAVPRTLTDLDDIVPVLLRSQLPLKTRLRTLALAPIPMRSGTSRPGRDVDFPRGRLASRRSIRSRSDKTGAQTGDAADIAGTGLATALTKGTLESADLVLEGFVLLLDRVELDAGTVGVDAVL